MVAPLLVLLAGDRLIALLCLLTAKTLTVSAVLVRADVTLIPIILIALFRGLSPK